MLKLLTRVFGSRNERLLRSYSRLVRDTNALEAPMQALSDEALRAKTLEFRTRIREQGALVWRLLGQGGYVYVCGSQPMRQAVRDAFVDVAADHGALSREQAEARLRKMEMTARYRPDLWTDLREPAWTYSPSS